MTFVPNPSFERELVHDHGFQSGMRQICEQIVEHANPRGQAIAPTYQAEVVTEGDEVKVQANAFSRHTGINVAGWIEFGTPTLEAAAPLRGAMTELGMGIE